MSHYKDVNGERLLCWGRAGDTYKMYMDSYFTHETDNYFEALGNAIEGSWESGEPLILQEITYMRDYGEDKIKDVVDIACVLCDKDFNVTVNRKLKK